MKNKIILFFSICIIYNLSVLGQPNTKSNNISPDSAIAYFNKVLHRNKNSSFAQYGLASAYYAKNDYNNALLYSKLNLKNKNDFDTACSLIYACSLDRTGRIKEAIEEFEKAIKKFPDNYLLWYQYALSNYKYREHKKVQEALNKSISINPYFVEPHYLMGCSMFENDNDARCIYPLLYGLLLDNDSARALDVIFFIKTYLEKKPDRINIPFFENRINIASIEDVLVYYFPVKSKWQIIESFQPIDLSEEIKNYLKTNYSQDKQYYPTFFNKLSESGQVETFIYYCLRTTRSEYVTLWFKNHSEQLKAFSEFLDKTLTIK